MQDDMIKMFKKNVPKQKKIYQLYIQDCKIQNFSYNNFKSNNVVLIELNDYLMSIEEYYYLSENQINNIFEYLRQNISVDNFSKIKKVYKILNDLSNYLSDRYNSKDSLHGDVSKKNCKYIINKIAELKILLAKKKNYNMFEIEKIINFENTVKKICNPKDFRFDQNKLLFIIDNFSSLLYTDRNNKDFNYIFCRHIENAKINREREKLYYYKSIYNYLLTIKELNLDYEYINYLFGIDLKSVDDKLIENKYKNMKVDSKTGKKIVDDYIISIDNDITKKIDDAFSIEKVSDAYLIGIHIADVYSLGYFKEGNLDYIKNNDINKSDASLTKDNRKNAISLYVLVDGNGIVRNYEMFNTVLKTNANLVYDDIPKLIRNENVNPELKNTIINLLSVYNLLENDKFPNNPTISNFAYLITSKLMILCCTLYSEEFKNKDIPAIYLCGDNKNNYYSTNYSNYYTGFNNYNTYTRVTSPIYEKSSLINQFFINRFLVTKRIIDADEKNQMTLKLKSIVKKMNKNKDI